MFYDVLPYLITAAGTSLVWAIAYRSQTGYLRHLNEKLHRQHVVAESAKLGFEAENENLRSTIEMLRGRLAKAIERGEKGKFGKPGLKAVA